MRKLLLNPTPLFRKLRQLSMLLTLLLALPQTAWGDSYFTINYGTAETSLNQVWVSDENNNLGNILGDGKMSYDKTNNVLTLNGIDLELSPDDTGWDLISCQDTNDHPSLTIKLAGTNKVTLGNHNPGFFYGKELTFITDTGNPGSLTITTQSGWEGKLFENSFSGDPTINPTYNNGLSLTQNGSTYTIAPSTSVTNYGLTIAGTAVTSANAANILAGDPTNDGKISFTPASNTLTLNGVTITPEGDAYGIKYTGTDNLSINLNGTNIVKGSGGCPAIGFYDNGSPTTTTPNLTFINGGTEPCSLQLEATTTPTIEGFGSVINTGLYKIEETITGNEGNTYKTTITSTILGGGSGSPDDPFIIATAADLKDFSSYVNQGWITTNGKYFKLSPSSGSTIDCNGLTGFEPIGKDSNKPFQGTFDGDNKMIKGLSVTYSSGKNVGLIGSLDGGTITQLILDGCTIIGGSSKTDDNYIGGIVGYVSNNGTVSKCKVQNESTISCNADSNSPIVGGIVGYLDGGTITECLFQGTSVNAVNTADGAATSGSIADAGGVVGKASGTVSNCQVKGAAEISAIYSITSNTNTGAIIGEMFTVTLSNNTYDYSVITKVQSSAITELTTYSGYTQRGIGKDVYAPATNVDITENNGAVMYTKIVSLPTANSAGTVEGVDGAYYKVDGTSLYVAPGQTAKINATPNTDNNFALAWLQTVKTVTADVVICDSTNIANGGRRYTFTMPDAEVTVNVSWDELYNLWIGDTQVTSNNAAHILGENNTTVTFTAADPNLQTSANTLTLNGATLTVPVKVGLASLTFDIKGTNSITTNTTCIQNVSAKVVPSLTFKSTSDEVGNLTLKNTDDSNTGVISSDYFGKFTISNELALMLLRSGDLTSNSYYFSDGEVHEAQLVPFYGVQVGETLVHSGNATDVLGDGTISFNKNTSTLTLNNANAGALSTSLAQLTVELVGNNTLTEEGNYPVLRSLNNSRVTINIQSTAETKGMLTMNMPYTNNGTNNGCFYDDNVTVAIIPPLDVISGSLTGNDNNVNTVIIGEAYNLSVAGTAVTILNKDNVLGDGKISFTPSSNTLTLDGATINGNINYNGTTDFTIALNGSNSIVNTGGTAAIFANTQTTYSFNFVKATGASSAELSLKWGSGNIAISAERPTLGSGLYWKPIEETTLIITDNPEFIIIDDYAMTDTRTTINGTSGTITYNPTDKVLTINGFTKEFGAKHAIKTGVTGLKVKLTGESTINCSADSTVFYAFSSSASIQFVKVDATSKLNMVGTAIDKFADGSVTYDGLVYYSEGTYIAVPTAPTMAEDNNKVKLTINYSGGTIAIKYSIDYADETADVTEATYSEPFAMTAPGTVEAWVEANGATTENDKVKGKYFGFKDAPFTLKADLVDQSKSETLTPVLIPAFVDGENIALKTTGTYESSAEGVATFADGTITAKGIGKATVTANIDYTGDVQPVVILNHEKKVTAEVNVGVTPSITFTPDMLYATYCNTGDKDLKVPDGLKAYAITGVNGNVVTLSQVEFLPKVNGTTYFPLLLKREDKNTEVGLSLEYDGTASAPTSNYLRYAISNVQTTGVEFVLYKDEFVKATGTILEQKCYLYLSGVSFTRGAYDIGDGTTAIDATLIDNEETNDYWYDLQGRRIHKPSKAGLYIKNGKKVIVNTK